MRKYFLLSAVVMLVATNANATSESATFQAKAQVNMVNYVTCSDLDFGTIYLKTDNEPSTLTIPAMGSGLIEKTGDITTYTGGEAAECTFSSTFNTIDENWSIITDDYLQLDGGEGDDMHATITDMTVYFDTNQKARIGGTLNIPRGFSGGTLTGTYTFTVLD
ncbi:MAG: DUF4402 domain-containing protein [Alphaproteobacteria bacterium]|nr:DUF4402 domain-containing protein [Alphaproteobacteria bacterium]